MIPIKTTTHELKVNDIWVHGYGNRPEYLIIKYTITKVKLNGNVMKVRTREEPTAEWTFYKPSEIYIIPGKLVNMLP